MRHPDGHANRYLNKKKLRAFYSWSIEKVVISCKIGEEPEITQHPLYCLNNATRFEVVEAYVVSKRLPYSSSRQAPSQRRRLLTRGRALMFPVGMHACVEYRDDSKKRGLNYRRSICVCLWCYNCLVTTQRKKQNRNMVLCVWCCNHDQFIHQVSFELAW